MKNKSSLKWLIAGLIITISTFTQAAFAQVETKRLPDGTIVYSDGSIKRPNGEMRYPKAKNGTTRLPDGTVIYPDGRTYPRTTTRGTRQPDGSIIYPDGRVRYPDGTVRYPDGTVRYPNSGNNNRTGWIPPGQAKKMYGAKSARDFAPGHNKGNNGHGNGHGKGKH
jgi:hypothetical protein